MSYQQIRKELIHAASTERALTMQRFFKTGKGEYGEGDKFHGVSVPQQRIIAKHYFKDTDAETIIALLHSDFHEERLTAIFILISKFKEDLKKAQEKVWVDLYLQHTHRINSWDLVDSSAHLILGKWLEDKDRSLLLKLAKSKLLWDNRIAIVATLHFIRNKDYKDIFELAPIMFNHPHDLMHKATGWMLREVWKQNKNIVEEFLDKHASLMPRTMLRYTIEKMEEGKRKRYLGI
ncbi:MAG: DNA alkylation repair protein [Chlamydiae bacterium]|nr:DNA alkylation repair protein [Chlamydiota bacterium]